MEIEITDVELLKLCEDIADALNTELDKQGIANGWAADMAEGCVWASLRGPGEAHLLIGRIWRSDRLEISPRWPAGERGSVYRPGKDYSVLPGREVAASTITVSRSKTAAQIAKDIQRRLLPVYLPQLAEQVRRKQADQDYRSKTLALATELAAILPAEVRQDHNGTPHFSRHSTGVGISCDVYRDDVTIKLDSLTPEQARTILQMFAKREE